MDLVDAVDSGNSVDSVDSVGLGESVESEGSVVGAVVAADDAAAMSRGKKGATSRQRQKRSDVYSEETA